MGVGGGGVGREGGGWTCAVTCDDTHAQKHMCLMKGVDVCCET